MQWKQGIKRVHGNKPFHTSNYLTDEINRMTRVWKHSLKLFPHIQQAGQPTAYSCPTKVLHLFRFHLQIAPNESPYMFSYMSTIQTESLSLIVFERFERKRPYDLWPWRKSNPIGLNLTYMKSEAGVWKDAKSFLGNYMRSADLLVVESICFQTQPLDSSAWPDWRGQVRISRWDNGCLSQVCIIRRVLN